jgi:hypothetical protein
MVAEAGSFVLFFRYVDLPSLANQRTVVVRLSCKIILRVLGC